MREREERNANTDIPARALPTARLVLDSRSGLADETGQYLEVAGSIPAPSETMDSSAAERLGKPGQLAGALLDGVVHRAVPG